MNQTHIEGSRSLAVAAAGDAAELPQFNVRPGEIDPFVQNSISATNGSFYQHLVGKLREYPIPNLQLPEGKGKSFLEIGCSWGRWCIAASRKGYHITGIDPSLKGIRAAKRVARQLEVEAQYLVADGRALPFPDESFDQVFSYSVLQHLSKENARETLRSIRKILRPNGSCLIQMPNVFGIRCLYHQTRRGFRETRDFEVRYWTVNELMSAFQEEIGPSKIFVDGYFSLNPQVSDVRFMPVRYRTVVHLSEILRKTSNRFRFLLYVADSLYVSANRKE
jgi:2-polyprenyl-3-methyl-5-hydroxy-6-metoxy-1,4-benzoquinol methylase